MLILECNQKWAWLWKTMSCPLDLEFFVTIFNWKFSIFKGFEKFSRSLETRRFCQKQLWQHPSFIYSVFATDIVIHCAVWLFHLGVMCVHARVCVCVCVCVCVSRPCSQMSCQLQRAQTVFFFCVFLPGAHIELYTPCELTN